MIVTHDAASGYLRFGLVNNWAKTQSTGFAGQLDCGARGMDVRPIWHNDKLVMHHGNVIVNVLLETALSEVVEWAERNPEEVVVLYLTTAPEDKRVRQVLDTLAIRSVPRSILGDITMGQLRDLGRLPNNGSIVAVFRSDIYEVYDPSIECYSYDTATVSRFLSRVDESDELKTLAEHALSLGKNDTQSSGGIDFRYSCYGKNSDYAFDRFWSYMRKVTEVHLVHRLKPWMSQAHWQYSVGSVAAGVEHVSTILLDESRSELNKKVLDKIADGTFPRLNLLELDNVCDHGPAIQSALQDMARRILA